jgi:hypothetical protein
MGIDPRAGEPARALLGHAICHEWEAYVGVIQDVGEEGFLECLSLYLRAAGYIAIDACGHRWPSDAELREIARRTAASELNLGVTELDVYEYLARCALGFGALAHAFPDPEQAASVPVLATATMLVSYRGPGSEWWDYLEQIELALAEADGLPENAFPAALLLSRRNHALKEQGDSDQVTSQPR